MTYGDTSTLLLRYLFFSQVAPLSKVKWARVRSGSLVTVDVQVTITQRCSEHPVPCTYLCISPGQVPRSQGVCTLKTV